jgi:hypothetical protein
VHEQVYDVKVDGNSTKNILVWRQRKLVVAAHEHLEEQKKTAHVCEVSPKRMLSAFSFACFLVKDGTARTYCKKKHAMWYWLLSTNANELASPTRGKV